MTQKSTVAAFVSKPNFNHVYEDLMTTIIATQYIFLPKPHDKFVILHMPGHTKFKLLPVTLHRAQFKQGLNANYIIVFMGTFVDLRVIASAFPLDLFGGQIVRKCS